MMIIDQILILNGTVVYFMNVDNEKYYFMKYNYIYYY